MESRTDTSSDGSQKSLMLSGGGRPAWQMASSLPGSSSRPSVMDPEIDGRVSEKQEIGPGLTERDYIGLAENSAFKQPSSGDAKKDDELSLGEEDLHLELGLGLGTAASRKNDCEQNTGYLLKQIDGELASQKEWTSKAVVPAESSRYSFPEAAAATLQKAWQNARPATADGHNSSTAQDYPNPSKVLVFSQDLEGGPSRVGLTTFYGPNVKNGTKRGYTEAMHSAGFDIASRIPAGKVAEGEAKLLPKHHQAPFLSKLLSAEPSASAHWVVGPEKPSTHPLVPRKEKMITENAPAPFNPPKNCKKPGANDPPPPKGQVVGWPPVPSYRKQNIAKPAEMYVKVNMDGMTVGRKIDLNAHSSYEGLYFTLEEMFQPSNNSGQGTLQSFQGRESHAHDGKQIRLLNGLEYVLTYEDEDGDWMMAGDFPWDMFVKTVRRLRIARRSEATGLAPTVK